MKSVNINKKYKVTIEFDITLQEVKEYSEINEGDLRNLVNTDLESESLIRAASVHIADEVLHFHEEGNIDFYDCLKFNVDNYKLKSIEEE